MFANIIDICERIFILNPTTGGQREQQQPQDGLGGSLASIGGGDFFDEKIYQLPSFLTSLAYVCNQLDDTKLPEGSVSTLEKLAVMLIDNYPKLIKRYNRQVSLAIAHLFLAVQVRTGRARNNENNNNNNSNNVVVLYPDFVSRIVYQSLVRIFSYKTSYFLQQEHSELKASAASFDGSNTLVDPTAQSDESESAATSGKMASVDLANITSRDYVAFWSDLLNLNEFVELTKSDDGGVEISSVDKQRCILVSCFCCCCCL